MKATQKQAGTVETMHNVNCKMAFGRKDPDCARCKELLNGAAPRKGWQADYYAQKKINDARFLNEIRNHDCVKSHCGVVCTFGEW